MTAGFWFQRKLARQRAPVTALDIGPGTARSMVLERSAQGWHLQTRQWPVIPGWIDGGHLMDYSALCDALRLWLAETGSRRVALSLPAEVCDCRLLKPPPLARWWRPGRWFEQQFESVEASQPWIWIAYPVADPASYWRTLCAPLERIQDWQGLIEAAGCELLALEDAHQASWRALDQWSLAPPSGGVLLQVGAACVQALQERERRWRWARRARQPEQDLLPLCLEAARSSTDLFMLGEGELAESLRSALRGAGFDPREPALDPALQGDPSFCTGSWSALGLAGLGYSS